MKEPRTCAQGFHKSIRILLGTCCRHGTLSDRSSVLFPASDYSQWQKLPSKLKEITCCYYLPIDVQLHACITKQTLLKIFISTCLTEHQRFSFTSPYSLKGFSVIYVSVPRDNCSCSTAKCFTSILLLSLQYSRNSILPSPNHVIQI